MDKNHHESGKVSFLAEADARDLGRIVRAEPEIIG